MEAANYEVSLASKQTMQLRLPVPGSTSFLTEYALTKHGQGDVDTAVKVFYDLLILDPENVTAKEYSRK